MPRPSHRRPIKEGGWLSFSMIVLGSATFATAQQYSPGFSPQQRMLRPAPFIPPGTGPQSLRPRPASRPGPPPIPPNQLPGPPGCFVDAPPVYAVRDYSWHYIVSPQPRQIKEQDIVTIIVKEISQVSLNNRFNRQRRGTYLQQLKEFIRIGKSGNLENAAENEPSISGTMTNRLNTTGRVTEQEEIVYRIAATVVNVLPNGNLVLEAHKYIQTDDEMWKYTLNGIVRSQDINRDNTALSENIANLQITKDLAGKARDSTKRGWGTKLFDWFFPF